MGSVVTAVDVCVLSAVVLRTAVSYA